MIEPLFLAKSKKEWFYIIVFLLIIFFINISFEFFKYKKFKQEEIITKNFVLLNIYKKEKKNILKLKNNDFIFFTSTQLNFNKQDKLQVTLLTKNISFVSYLRGFYSFSFNLNLLKKDNNFLISKYIKNQHKNENMQDLFLALFLAIPINKDFYKTISSYGISHLIAISGFHLGILAFILYWIIYILIFKFYIKYMPYRNIKYDILITSSILLFLYLNLIGNVASFLRSFLMFVFAIFTLRSNIKLFSFSTLLIITLLIIAIFPKLLFSLSLFFSIAGVFYIFLFFQCFKNLNKIFLFLIFNFWIFFALNPIIHYFFPITSFMQIISPILTILFSIFYPLELFLHIINYGDILDSFIISFFNINFLYYYTYINSYMFFLYIIFSILSIWFKFSFIILNIFFIIFAFNLYIKI